jgi:hypothetical protein
VKSDNQTTTCLYHDGLQAHLRHETAAIAVSMTISADVNSIESDCLVLYTHILKVIIFNIIIKYNNLRISTTI